MPDVLAVREAIAQAARWLPHQGPLSVFIHHNTLSELEHLDFQEALSLAEQHLGARVRLPEREYREMLADGRILPEDLAEVFDAENIPARIIDESLPDERAFAWTMLTSGFRETHWRIRAFQIAEGQPDPVVSALEANKRAKLADEARRLFASDADAAVFWLTGTREISLSRRRLREQHALADTREAFVACMRDQRRASELGYALLSGIARAHLSSQPAQEEPVPLEPLHRRVDETLLPVVAALLDLGQAAVRPPDLGLFELGRVALSRDAILGPHASALLRSDAISTLCAALDALGISGEAVEPSLRRILLARPGWAGAIAQRSHGGRPLEDYAALRLIASIGCARSAGLSPEVLFQARSEPLAGMGLRADRVAQLLATQGVGPAALLRLNPAVFAEIEAIIGCYGESWRCRVLQEAREQTARRVWLAALQPTSVARPLRPKAQIICCIDDREESFRRAAEEHGGDDIETFGAAGHFQLTIRWRGARDVRPSARHPVVLASTHRVEERSLAAPARQRARGALDVWVDASLDPVRGAVAALVAGLPSLVLAASQVLAPGARRWTAHARPRVPGELLALRDRDPEDDLPLGFSEGEAADRIYDALHNIGLTSDFAPIIAVLGHRSTSENNPFSSAYECGACGGSPGDGNARTFAKLANDPRVRSRLAERGLFIAHEVRFIGGVHDTSTDEVILWPSVDVSERELSWLTEVLARAAEQDAYERSRRFLSLPEGGAGRSHAQVRSADLSEVRPEYCHATNALLVVGPRTATRGLFLDRRALLHSYDPERDTDGAALVRVLGAAVPVCAGINLEYYFSRVDNERLGAGTKLPHNLVGLHGLMNGSLGDLRTGLPLQTVEIHEPTRLLVVVYAPRERIERALSVLPAVARLVENRWVWLAAIDSGGVWLRQRGCYVPFTAGDLTIPEARDSQSLFRGRHDPLPPARISR